jgi:hypothetical protein
MQVPFDFTQDRLSAPLKNASLRMTASLGDSRRRHLLNEIFRDRTTELFRARRVSGLQDRIWLA